MLCRKTQQSRFCGTLTVESEYSVLSAKGAMEELGAGERHDGQGSQRVSLAAAGRMRLKRAWNQYSLWTALSAQWSGGRHLSPPALPGEVG